jgi:hypothetical protein
MTRRAMADVRIAVSLPTNRFRVTGTLLYE